MKSFFSIIYVRLNEFTEERYAIGLIAGDERSVKFDYHADKLEILNHFYPSAQLTLSLLESFKSMRKRVMELNKESRKRKSPIICERNSLVDYINYLSVYSKGMLQFSNALPIAAPITTALFNKLFKQLVYIGETLEKVVHSPFSKDLLAQVTLYDLHKKVDLDFNFTPDKIDGIYSDTIVNLATYHESIMVIQYLDFTETIAKLVKQLDKWNTLLGALKQYNKTHYGCKGKYHLFFTRPLPNSAQERMLNRINNSLARPFAIYHSSEIHGLLNALKEKDYLPVSEIKDFKK